MMTDIISHLEWDSEFFGKRVGSLSFATGKSLDGLLQNASKQGYKLLYVYSHSAIQQSLSSSFSLLDVGGQILFTKSIPRKTYLNIASHSEITEYMEKDFTPELLHIAFLSGHLSRFRIDPMIPTNSFERLYEIWLRNTLNRQPNAGIFTYTAEGKLAGLISAEWDQLKCTIGLLAVLPTHEGLGMGSKLLKHIELLCVAKGIGRIEVKTQLSNAKARSLYLKNFFKEHNRSFLYHGHQPSR